MNEQAFLGMLIAQFGVLPHAMGKGGKEPVAYSYNGTILPKLPEWDKTKYSYAVITQLPDGNIHMCFSTELPEPARFWGVNCVYFFDEVAYKHYDFPDGKWLFVGEGTGNLFFSPEPLLWTSHDILNDDGSVYFTASEPIPIYN